MKPCARRLGGVLLCVALACAAPLRAADERPALPDFSAPDNNGRTIHFDAYRGQVVLVNFWATWCPPCVAELPSMQSLKQQFADKPFEVLAINMGEDADTVNRFADSLATKTGRRFNFPLLLDEDLQVIGAWRVRGLPTSFIADKRGRAARVVLGPKDWTQMEFRDLVAALLSE